MEKIQERALRFVTEDYDSPISDILVNTKSKLLHVSRYCIVAFPPSQISPRKTGYIVAFPPENWLYSSFSPGEILLYSQISPFL